MKKNVGTRICVSLCIICMTFGLFTGCSTGSVSMSEQDATLYMVNADNKKDFTIYYDENGVIPYISAEDIGPMLQDVFKSSGVVGSLSYSYETDGNHVIYTRESNGYTMKLDFSKNTITFNDFDMFFKQDNSGLVDMVWMVNGSDTLYQRSGKSIDRYGKELVIDLKPYNIKMVKSDGNYYVPLQTVSDLLLGYFDASALFNGKDVFVVFQLEDDLKAIFDSGGVDQWSEEFAEYNYNSLCLALDYQYGLKEIHEIESFDKLCKETGLKNEFLNGDSSSADQALYKLIYFYLGDVHTQLRTISYMSDSAKIKELTRSEQANGLAYSKMLDIKEQLTRDRDNAYPEGIPAYEEVGNTAYITFDKFTDPEETIDYYATPTDADNNMTETIRLMQYACSRILREGSPIKNVVLDLSINGGGSTTAAEYVMATFLGEADFSTKNTMTGAMTNALYTVDTNMDRVFDEKDTLADKGLNLYCISTPYSFSCGNLVPSVFKASQEVTLLGKTSGGGSCSIYSMSTANGSTFCISGFRRFSVMKNGSFYDIDTGAEPNYFIEDSAKYYNRAALTGYINSLY